jgi:hypothetical protein
MPSHPRSHSLYALCTSSLGDSNRRTCAQKARWRPRIAQCALLFAILIIGSVARADTVALDNGDRLTGTIERRASAPSLSERDCASLSIRGDSL